KRIAEERPVMQVDDAAERTKRQIGRPSRVTNFRQPVVEILQEPPDLATLEILRRVRESGYRGGKTALYALVASLRPKPAKPLVRFEGLPGEFSQHDFGQVEVEFRDGASQRIHFFASRLKYSRFMCVSLVRDEAVESLVRTLAEHLASWGGAPLQCVFDRPKTVALKWRKNGEVTEWNPVFAYATLEMGVGVERGWRIPGYVGTTGTVLHDSHAYSMPPEAISMPATLYLYGQRVRIVAGRYEAVHPRKFVAHEGSSLAEHRAALVAAVSGKRGQRYLKRQQLLELGEPAIRYLTEIVHRRPRQWYEDVDRLHAILQSHGPEVLRR